MKTIKKVTSSLLIALLLVSFSVIAQEKETATMAELSFMKPKNEHVKEFENAVKKHNEKYHTTVPYKAGLNVIATGPKAGWYAWVMGPCTFTDLDGRPDDEAHGQDWETNVTPHVAKYGAVEYWRYNKDLSHTNETQTKFSGIWFIDVKKGEYEKFEKIIKNIKAVFAKSTKETMGVYNNRFNAGDGRDVALVFDFDKWAELDDDSFKTKDEYEKMYGEGTWKTFLDDWNSSIEKVSREVWKEVR